MEKTTNKEWYKTWWGIILAILLIFPFAIWYIWAKTKWSNAIKIGVTGAIIILFFMSIGSIGGSNTPTPSSTSTSNTNSSSTVPVAVNKSEPTNSTANEPVQSPVTTAKTPQQILDDNILSSAKSYFGSSTFNYLGNEIEPEGSDRPKDTNMITIKIRVNDFFDKNALLRDTGNMSSSVIQAVFNTTSLNPYDVIVWYYGKTTDKYGNQKDDVVLTNAIDKGTYEKINWQNFDKANLCTFLRQESSGNLDTACAVLANIQ
jgi:hypothetical protein